MKTSANSILGQLIEALPELSGQHDRGTKVYHLLDTIAKSAVPLSPFAENGQGRGELGAYGELIFPFTKMGAIDSLDLFGLDELIIFAFYWANRARYKKAADIGANLGLHSLMMARCGWSIKAYEPDPTHASILRKNLAANDAKNVELIEAAVSDQPGTLEFVRVLGNTTSSHLAGAKAKPYGELERFPVRVETIANIMPSVDFVKMDAEGQEKIIILGTDSSHWRAADMMVEVGTPENAEAIFSHLAKIGVNAFGQKLGWKRVVSLPEMPISYRDGSLFISTKSAMPWGN